MKKEYKTPLMETVIIKSNIQLMAGSPVNGEPTMDDGYKDPNEFDLP